MENNAAMFVDSLLARFGTTMDRLMPAIIDFGRYECRYTVRVCIWLIGVGIIFAIVARFLDKHNNIWEWAFWIDALFVVGMLMIIISVFTIVVALCTLQKWNDFPEMMAYKYIFGLMR